MGLKVVAVDKNHTAIGLKQADIGIAVDIAEEQQVIEVARQYNVVAVIPAPIGRYLTTVGGVNDALNLKGISSTAAEYCTDKVKFHSIAFSNGIRRPRQFFVGDRFMLHEAIQGFGFPCIIKPRFGSGSKGVFAILNPNELDKTIQQFFEEPYDNIILEEFIEGNEVGFEGVVQDGNLIFHLFRDKKQTELPFRKTFGSVTPARLPQSIESEICWQVNKCIEVIGLKDCLINADIIVNQQTKKSTILEITGRPAGTFIASEMIPLATDFEFLETGIKIALGFPVEIRKNTEVKPTAMRLLYDDIKRLPKKTEDLVRKKFPGLLRFSTGGEYDIDVTPIKYMITTGASIDEALLESKKVYNYIRESGDEG
ncbi:acetyl-CoA carboxylase biotin carboxylase subunit family protein [Paenibacillus lentus]